MALFTLSTTCHCRPGVTCFFCEQPGHCTHKCKAFKDAKTHVKSNHGHFRQPKKANKASKAQAASTAPSTSIEITLGDDSQCTVIIVYLTNTDLGDDSQCTRGKAVQLQIKYLSR